MYVEDLPKGDVTDKDGHFRIADVPEGERTVVAELILLSRSRTPLVVTADEQRVNVVMTPNRAIGEAAARYVPPAPEHLAQKRSYLASLPTSVRRPNIVVILFDDLGYGDLCSYGNRLIRTPNIDRWAADGVRFTDAYSAHPVCTPSRAALLTGRYPQRALAANHVFFPESSPVALLRRAAGWTNALMTDEVLLPEILARAGYRTQMVGKWHLGDRNGHRPGDFGFEHSFALAYSNDMDPLQITSDGTVAVPVGTLKQEELTERFTRAAEEVIAAKDDRPLFLYLAYTAPHVPHAVGPASSGRSQGGLYGDVVEELDAAVGRVRTALATAGLEDDTLVVITSDNGADRGGDAGAVRGIKSEAFEGGMRVPLFLRWPGGVEGGTVRQGMAMLTDVVPTILGALGLPMPRDRVLDGRDLLPFAAGLADSPHEHLFYTDAVSGHAVGVRDERYKYRMRALDQLFFLPYPGDVSLPVYDAEMLTDLDLDRERLNLIDRLPERAAALRMVLDRFRAQEEANPRGWR